MNQATGPQHLRYTELDSLRGLAALTVFFSHALSMITLTGLPEKVLKYSPLHIFWDGAAAVDLFFVLSGFVLSLPFLGDNPRKMQYTPFAIKRVFRIYPAYYAALIIAVLLRKYAYTDGGFADLSPWIAWIRPAPVPSLPVLLKHAVMIGPSYDFGEIDPVIWSLIIEMKVSLLYPFVILLLRRIKTFGGAAALLAAIAGLAWLTDIVILSYVPLFLLGGILAKFRNVLVAKVSRASLTARMLSGCVGLVLYTFRYTFFGLVDNDTAADYIIGAGVFIIIVLAISNTGFSALLRHRSVKFLGDISYSFYLLHYPILVAVSSLIYPRFGLLGVCWTMSLLLGIAASYITYRLVEQPFQKIGRIFAGRVQNLLDRFVKKLPFILTAEGVNNVENKKLQE